MPRNGSGVYIPVSNSFNPAVPDTEINADDWNAQLSDLAEAMTDSIASDGQTTIVANIPMSGFKLTGVGLATTLGDALSYGRNATVAALTATTFNGNTWTAGTGTLTLGAGKTLTASNTLTFTGTDGSSVNFGAGGTVLYSGGAGFVSSIAGTANEITASASTGAVTLSLPSALTFTGKTVTGGTFASPTMTGTPVVNTRNGAAGQRDALNILNGNVAGTGDNALATQMTDNISTGAATILTSPRFAALVVVQGDDGSNFFSDILNVSSATFAIISSLTNAGSPAARTYSVSAGSLRLQMASGTYNVNVGALCMDRRG